MTHRRHAIVMMLCAVMLLFLFVSSAYIAHEAAHPHDCTGEHCPVCQFIAQLEQLRRSFGAALVALAALCLAPIARRSMRALTPADVPAFATPVGLKIRLNN